jgi:LmbE family N-acetylglucosaminyl deacetylase
MSDVMVAVAAHCDDVELNAGGTVARWAGEGGEVHIVMVTNNCSGAIIPDGGDESGKLRLPPAETMRIRRREQLRAADLIGAEVHFLDYCQRHYWDGEQEVNVGFDEKNPPPEIAGSPQVLIAYQQPRHYRALGDLLGGLDPAVVLTHGPLDVDPEHHAVCSMVWLAFRDSPRRFDGVSLRFWTPGSSIPWGIMEPGYDYLEDISGCYEKKLELCRCHASQMTAARLETVRKRAEFYGRRLEGATHAEPFNTARNWEHGAG